MTSEPKQSLHPDAESVIELIRQSGRPPYEQLTPEEARDAYARGRTILQPDRAEVARVRNLSATGPAGAIPLRLYRGMGTKADARLPVLIYFHGGGWMFGDLDSHDGLCREFANRAQCCVISVDYRLAPEHKFPAAVDDSEAAVRWIAANAETLGIDAKRMAVGGDSAGGNLAAVMCLMARDGTLPKLGFQLLIYPATDMGLSTPSYARVVDTMPLTAATMVWFRDYYVREAKDIADWRASPLRAANHKEVAPAYILTVHYDPLCDEGRDYGAALERAGVAVQYQHIADQFHGFITMGKLIRACDPAIEAMAAALRKALAG